MSNGNHVNIIGNLTRDPELRFTPTGQATAGFGLAVNRRWQNRQTQEWEEATSFFDVVCWGQLAENAAQSLSKGSRVIVSGRLDQRSWETAERERRSKVEITADEIAPSLRWATAVITRNERRAPDGSAGVPVAPEVPRADQSQMSRPPTTSTKRSRSSPWPATTTGIAAPSGRIKDTRPRGKKKVCIFCKDHATWVDYKDINLLRRFMSDRGKIRARRVTGNCSQHQRDVQVAIKTARELALLPYTQRTVNERGPGRGPGRPGGRRDDSPGRRRRPRRGHRRRRSRRRRRGRGARGRTRSIDSRSRWERK